MVGSAVGVAPGWSVLLPGRLAHPNIGELEPGHKEGRWADTNIGAIWGVKLPSKLLKSN